MDEFLNHYLAGSEESTRAAVTSAYRRHFLPAIEAGCRTPEAAIDFFMSRRVTRGDPPEERPLGAWYLKKLMSLYRAWHRREFGEYPETGRIMQKVTRKIPRKIPVYWTPAQAALALTAAYQSDDEIYDRLIFMLHTGARREDMYALTKFACRFDEERSIVALCSEPITGVTKTGKAIAKKMTPELKEVLMRRCAGLRDDERVFGELEMRHRLRRVCEIARIPVKRWHAMRHCYVSTLLNAGANLKEVSTDVGHSSIKTTADTYWWLQPSQIDQSVLPRRKDG